MMKRYTLYIWMMMFTLLMVTSCTDHDFFGNEEEMVNVTYTIGFSDTAGSRAIGDGNNVDKLYIGIYEDGEIIKRLEKTKGDNGIFDITISLFKEHTYDLAFWAQSSNTSVYDRTDLKNVAVTYPEEMTLQEAANMDAFYLLKKDVTVATGNDDGGDLILTRPYAMLNIAATGDYDKVQKTELTVKYTNEDKSTTITFTGSEVDGEHTYLASVFLKPGSITAGVRLLGENDEEIKCFDVNGGETLELKANYRYNVIGNVVVEEELPCWNGVVPSESTLTQDGENRYIIDEEADLAWLSQNASSLSECSSFLVAKETLDMANLEISSIQLPAGSTFDGGGNTIKNYANSLFGNATNITVRNLNLDHVVAKSVDGHVGVLVNTLTGRGTFTDVSISNSSAKTENGAAGGMIGYIVRSTEKDRSETLAVQFNNCDLASVSASGSQAEGKFVGLLSGYDNGETLTFDADCSADATVADFVSPYKSTNQSVWCGAIADTYDGWLGDEVYCRGRIQFNDNQFVLRWTGRNGVEPLDANEKLDGITSGKVIYSPTDMAWFQEKNYTSANVYLRSDLDMGDNDSEDAPVFRPIQSVKYLDGLKKDKISFSSFDDCYKIQNIKVEKIHANGNGAAFILTGAGGQTHQNLVFEESKIISRHDENIDDIDDSNYGNAYAGTIVCKVTGAYTVQNVKVLNGSVYGVCKMGGLIGYVSGNLQAVNCVVDQCTITNYDPQCINWYYQKEEISSFIAYAKDSFYTDGEVGGLIGFITASSPIITDCSVTNTTIDCTGEADKSVSIGVYTSSGFDENNLSSPLATGKVTIAGRHVNQFIGDIRTQAAGNTITISNPYVENNTYNRDKNEHLYSDVTIKTKTKEWTEGTWVKKYYRTYDCSNTRTYSAIVGCAYVVAVTVNVDALGINKHVGDVQGTVKINNTGISETSTESENQTSGNETEWNGLLPETWQCTYNWKYYSIWNPKGESSFEKFVGDDFSL